MSENFHLYRRDVDYLPARPASILPLLAQLEFAHGNWGWKLRLGLIEITPEDSARIAEAMNVALPDAAKEPADGDIRSSARLPARLPTRLPDVPRRSGRRRA
jgi:hypothetical protein